MEVIYLSWKRNEEDLELINNTIWPYLKCWQAINVFFLIQDDEHKEGIPLTEEDPQEDEDLNEVNVNQRNGVDAFEGDIMMTAEQWEEMKREFKRTGQPMP